MRVRIRARMRVLVVSVLTGVIVLVEVDMKSVLRRLPARDHLDPALLDAAGGEDPVSERLQLSRRALEDDHLEAVGAVEMHVHRRAHLGAEPVLQLDEALGEISHVVVVDERHGRDGVGPLRDLRPRHLGAREIAKHLRARAPSLLHERVERPQERAFHGHTEPHQT